MLKTASMLVSAIAFQNLEQFHVVKEKAACGSLRRTDAWGHVSPSAVKTATRVGVHPASSLGSL